MTNDRKLAYLPDIGMILLNRTLEAMQTPRTPNDEEVRVYAGDNDLMPQTIGALENMAALPNATGTDEDEDEEPECTECQDGLIEYTVRDGDTETAYCTCGRGDDRRNGYTAKDAREDAGDRAYHFAAEESAPEAV